MARDWNIPDTLARTIARLGEFGANTAEFPISMTQERAEDGSLRWVVDIHVRIPRKTEFEISAEGETLSEALRSAYLGLNNPNGVIRRASAANEAFGIAV